ncbi:hypothetical protein PRIPAC_95932 [Pristionchus pacificus]|uniref:Uncharacterized protein n=1 Tax=Pristionchus pacificus TaxID=54126 RepID=A0A2A6BCK1_PRIPA|nr:hypothetical protein PRIPAC_95932 [Pristionchus pacificus]|eukprot:PDM63605.1 hypothetical protein PRIPAC_49578 [Pristionchus pacificus]
MRSSGFTPSLILILLIFEPLHAIPTTEKPVVSSTKEGELQYPSRSRRACCAYSSYSSYSIKCGTIPCGSCCYRTPPPAFPVPFVIPPLPFTIPPSLPPSPTAISGCTVCG